MLVSHREARCWPFSQSITLVSGAGRIVSEMTFVSSTIIRALRPGPASARAGTRRHRERPRPHARARGACRPASDDPAERDLRPEADAPSLFVFGFAGIDFGSFRLSASFRALLHREALILLVLAEVLAVPNCVPLSTQSFWQKRFDLYRLCRAPLRHSL